MAIFPRTTVPIGQPLTFRPAKGVHPAFAADPVIVDDALGLEVDDGQIGVIAESDASLAGDAENTLRAGAGQIDEAGKAEASRIDVVEHHRHERLHARHAGGSGRVALRLLIEGVRRVIGAENVDHALSEPPPQALPMARIAERRVHLRESAELLVDLRCREGQMLGRDFDGGDVLVAVQGAPSPQRSRHEAHERAFPLARRG